MSGLAYDIACSYLDYIANSMETHVSFIENKFKFKTTQKPCPVSIQIQLIVKYGTILLVGTSRKAATAHSCRLAPQRDPASDRVVVGAAATEVKSREVGRSLTEGADEMRALRGQATPLLEPFGLTLEKSFLLIFLSQPLDHSLMFMSAGSVLCVRVSHSVLLERWSCRPDGGHCV